MACECFVTPQNIYFVNFEKKHTAELTSSLRTIDPCLKQGFGQHRQVLPEPPAQWLLKGYTQTMGRKILNKEK